MKSLFKQINNIFWNKVSLYIFENVLGLITAVQMKDIMSYIKAMFEELFGKTPVKFAKYIFTTNKTLQDMISGAVIDGLTLAENDVICLSGQATGVENGLWLIRNVGIPVRPDNYLTAEMQQGVLIVVLNMVNMVTNRVWVSTVSGPYISIDPYQPTEISNSVTFPNITADTTFIEAIPAGKAVVMIIFENSTNNVAQLSLGTDSGAIDVFSAEIVEPNKATIPSCKRLYNRTSAIDLYLHHGSDGDMFNGAEISMTLVFINI